ncbi:MAG: hypothetical protein Kow0092_04940 [Deferrisomatales bacterium]
MLRFTELTEEHAEQVLSWRTREDIAQQMLTRVPADLDRQRAWIRSLRDDPSRRYWVVLAGSRPIGVAYLTEIDPVARSCSWGYYLGDRDSKGLGGLLPACLYNHVFGILGFGRIRAEVFQDNRRVIALHRAAGYVEVGRRRHGGRAGARDTVLLELTREAWARSGRRFRRCTAAFDEPAKGSPPGAPGAASRAKGSPCPPPVAPLTYRPATEEEGPAVATLLAGDGNPYGWTPDRWAHFYSRYPEGEALSLVALAEGGVPVGHYGLLPVRVPPFRAMLGVHAWVRPEYRGAEIICRLLGLAEELCRERGVHFLCGFPNATFLPTLRVLAGWRAVGYLGFRRTERFDPSAFRGRFRFRYSTAWYRWRFGPDRPAYVSLYEKDGQQHFQLLKTRRDTPVSARDLALPHLQVWDPEQASRRPAALGWCQAFAARPLVAGLPDDLWDIDHWYLEMGDSDAFVYTDPQPPRGRRP